MAYDDEDLFDEEFDFVDDDDSDTEDSEVDEADSSVEEEAEPAKPKQRPAPAKGAKADQKRGPKKQAPPAAPEDEEFAAEVDEPVEPVAPGPPADHVVHIYEFGDYKRTIQREFTAEDSIKFAEEFNRTSKSYGRHAVPVERDEEPEPHL